MTQYVEDLGLTASRSINGINTAKGKFTFPDDDDASLAWAGIGQYEDLINPCTMLTYMGAIASGGRAVVPDLIHSVQNPRGIPLQIPWKKHTKRLISESTADELAELMHNNVVTNYGEGNYPGLDLCAKSGTAEVGGDLEPNAWFAGFLRNEDAPYAFIVLVEMVAAAAELREASPMKSSKQWLTVDSCGTKTVGAAIGEDVPSFEK